MNSQMAFPQSCRTPPMARFASDSITLHRIPLCFRIPHPLLHPSAARFPTSRRQFSPLACQTLPNSDTSSAPEKSSDGPETAGDTTGQPASSSSNQGFPEFPNKDINRRVAVISTVSALALFSSSRLDFGVSLKDLAAVALPYEEALSNGKPTVVEFYADWCEVCRELAPDVYKVEQQFKDRVNFVMLNVDNTKWEQELDEFGVEGIPHFAFLDKQGNEEGNVVGRLPRQYLLENVDALARGEASIPHARVVGQFSSAEARKVHQISDPRSHG
ncbi:thioredoxin-like protein HCF164, chloroplastic [Benincasa hispida]|uniref:thioredoxin-like protein HCF164, chloroplastic n=1 Tax=Benincasa hispida TaxID=102211 RepID=UPI001901F357|nr:thioredoxin-like protein HCF164, chloroplastic [Benincasa hispida]